MSRPIDDLSSIFHENVIDILKKNNYYEIWDDQWECIQKCLFEQKNIYIGLPTGSGKTFPAMLSIIDTVLNKEGKAVYIVPLRALARQKYEQFKKILAPLGLSVGISTGDYAKSEYTNIGKKDVIVATIEKVDSLIRHNEEWLYDVSLFVIDEIQMVDDSSRGLTLEIVVSEIIRKFNNAQRIALSAVIGNPKDFENWLADDYVFNDKPIIPLHKGVLTYFGKLKEVRRFEKIIPIRNDLYNFRVPKTDKGKSVRYSNTIDLVKYFVNDGKQCVIFANARDHAEKLALSLAKDIESGEYDIDKTICAEVSTLILDSIEEETDFSNQLIHCTRFGVSFHHAGLYFFQREIIERAFENKQLKVLVATPTLEQGVNLPINVVIISDWVRWNGSDYEQIQVNSVLNMMGRAGRPGYHKYGEAILIEDQSCDGTLHGRYISKSPEKVLSQLRIARTRQKHLNGLIASNKITPENKIFEYLKTTLWFTMYGYEFEEFDLKNEILNDLSYLKENGFIKKSGYYYIPTEFGKIVSDSCIDCETGLLFLKGSEKIIKCLEKIENIEPWSIFQLLLLSPEINTYRPYDNNNEGLEIASQFDDKNVMFTEIPNETQDETIEIYSQRSLAASLFCDWIEEKPLKEIFNKHSELRDADFYEIGEVLEWLGDALVKIAILIDVPKEITDEILIICDRVVGGVKEELLEYLRIEGVRRTSARTLHNAGFSYFSLKDLNHKTLSKLVGPFVSGKIREHFKKIQEEEEKPIFDEEEIYKEVEEIIAEEKQITHIVQKLETIDEILKINLEDENLRKRFYKIRQFCENQLTYMHSDSKYFRFFTNHGTPHSNNVFNLIIQLLDNWELEKGEKRLNEYEYFLLAVCSWCHDLGMLKQKGENFDDFDIVEQVRNDHARRIIQYLEKNYLKMGLSDDIEKSIISKICLCHSSNENIENIEETQEILFERKPIEIRPKLLAALLRFADALDADKNRLPREEDRDHPLISETTKREYKKHELVQDVVISPEKESVFIQVLVNKDSEAENEIYKEIEEKLNDEFNSVKKILLDYGINIKELKFFIIPRV